MEYGRVDGNDTLDTVVIDFANNTITTLLGDGLGGFSYASSHTFPGGLKSADLGDVNGDLMTDVVVIAGLEVAVLAGMGDGLFELNPSPAELNEAQFTTDATLSDVNDDGVLDLVYTTHRSGPGGDVWIWAGNGAGNFALLGNHQVFPYPEQIEIADVNDDGIIDIGAVNNGDSIVFLLGEGAGAFSSPIGFGIEGIASDFAFGDVDGDADLDVVVLQSHTLYDESRLITLFGDPALYP